MPIDPTQAVLRDFENIAWLTIALGLAGYAVWRFFFSAPANPEEPGPEADRHRPVTGVAPFFRADLLILPLVLIKYSVTLQLLTADLSSAPGKIAAWLGLRPETASAAGPSAPPPVEMTPTVIVFDLLLNLILISLVVVMISWVGQRNVVKVFGLDRLGPFKLAIWTLIGAAVATPAILLFSLALPSYLEPLFGKGIEEQAAVLNIRESSDLAFKVLLILNAVLVAPLVEEVVFRGYFYGVMKHHTSAMFAAFTTAAIFAAAHQNVLALLPLWGLALLLTLAYEAGRCLWIPIGMHAIFNAVNVTLILLGFGEAGG